MTVPTTTDATPKSFAILLASSAIGGAERFLVELAIAMRRTTSRPTILNLKSPMPYAAELQKHDIDVQAGIAERRLDALGLSRLIRALRRTCPEVLLINSNRQAMLLGAVASRWCRIPITLVHTHEHLGKTATTMRYMARFTDGIVAAAESHRTYLHSELGLPLNRVVRVYPGVNFARTGSTTGAGDRVGSTLGIVAALRPEKDHETFLKAAAIVARQLPDSRFVVVGDGPRRPYLEALARQLHIGERIKFLGWQPVNAELLQQFDVLTLSSLSETFPAVILEAFSAGVTVVATDVGSVAELLGTPPCGVLVPPKDPSALANALIALLTDRTRAQQLRTAAAQRVHYFSADRFCHDMLRLTRTLVAARSDGGFPDISCILDQSDMSGQST